jgi:hypothetical protein
MRQRTKTRSPKHPRPKREGVEQVLPDEQTGVDPEQAPDAAAPAEPQRRDVGETGEDEDMPASGQVERGPDSGRTAEP